MDFFSVFRYDFVLEANQKSDIYFMRFGGLLDCIRPRAHTAAILIYDNVMDDEVSISPTFYEQLLGAKIPKAQKDGQGFIAFLCFWDLVV